MEHYRFHDHQIFLIGPAALLLYTLGQYVRADEGEHLPTLWKALAVGVVAAARP